MFRGLIAGMACFWTVQCLAAPQLASVSAIATDLENGEVLVAKHKDLVLPIASLTKVMTALVVLESGEDMDAWLEIQNWHQDQAKNAYSRIRLESRAKRKDLVRIALMSSENRAAYNLAVNHPGGFKEFVRLMNVKATELGMDRSVFDDPTGLSVGNESTAHDLSLLVAAAHKHKVLGDLSTTRQHTVNFRGPRYRLGYGNTNPLTGSSRWDVLLTKTGYLTEAGRCLVMAVDINGQEVAMVFLNSFGKRSPLGDAGRIKRWLSTGDKGSVAPAARAYALERLSEFGL